MKILDDNFLGCVTTHSNNMEVVAFVNYLITGQITQRRLKPSLLAFKDYVL